MRDGHQFPPIVLIRISFKLYGYPYRIYDGCHRARAAKHIGHETIAAYVPSWKAVCADMTFWDDANYTYLEQMRAASMTVNGMTVMP